MMAELFGRQDGYSGGKGGSMHIADFSVGMLGANGIVAAGLPIATGVALAASIQGTDGVAVCMFGDGAVGAGPFHESLNIASLWKLPVIFVCENNGWASTSAPESILAAATVASFADTYAMAGEVVDGNDVLAVGAATRRAVLRARSGGGPTLIEALTFRMEVHAYRGGEIVDNRDPDLVSSWQQRDPLLRLAASLLEQGAVTPTSLAEIQESVDRELVDAVEFARNSPMPDVANVLADVFAL